MYENKKGRDRCKIPPNIILEAVKAVKIYNLSNKPHLNELSCIKSLLRKRSEYVTWNM